MRKIVILLIFIVGVLPMFSQIQELNETDLIWNRRNINPAFTAESKAWDINAQLYKQWFNFPGSPTQSFVSTEKYFPKIFSGFALENRYESFGITRDIINKAYYVFRFNVNDKFSIAAGSSAGINIMEISFRNLKPKDPDVSLPAGQSCYHTILNIGTAFRFMNHTVGVSFNDILNHLKIIEPGSFEIIPYAQRNLHFDYSYRFNLGKSLTLTPTLYWQQFLQLEQYVYGGLLNVSFRHKINAGYIYKASNNENYISNQSSLYFSYLIAGRVKTGLLYSLYIHETGTTISSICLKLGVLLGKTDKSI